MKPKNWKKMSDEEQIEYALKLLKSPRGEFLTSQAFYIAVKELKKVNPPHREESNIEDMEILLEKLFKVYPLVAEAERRYREAKHGET
jgi:hypothetical protein